MAIIIIVRRKMEDKQMEGCNIGQNIDQLDAITTQIEKMQYLTTQIFDKSATKMPGNGNDELLSNYQLGEINKCSSILLDYMQSTLEDVRKVILEMCKLEEKTEN